MSKGQHEKWKNKNRIQNEKTNFFYNVFLYFGLHVDANELRRKLARGEEEHANKTRQFNEEVRTTYS